MKISDEQAQDIRIAHGDHVPWIQDLLDDREKLILVQVAQKGIIESYQKHFEKTEKELKLRQTLLESEAAENDRLVAKLKERVTSLKIAKETLDRIVRTGGGFGGGPASADLARQALQQLQDKEE